MENRKLIIVEGNIAAGKSTLCKDLATILNYGLFIEPTDSNPYLEKYYKEPKKYAYKMQIWFLRQRFTTYCQAIRYLLKGMDDTGKKINGVILDRSIFSDSVFAEQNYVDGNFSFEEYDEYLKFRNKLLDKVILPDVMLYLNASPETCYERIHKLRKRAGEEVIPLAYLTGLSNCYQTLIDELTYQTSTNVVLVPWNTFGKSQDICNTILKTLLEQKQREEEQVGNVTIPTKTTGTTTTVDIDDDEIMDIENNYYNNGTTEVHNEKLSHLQEIVATDQEILNVLNHEESKCIYIVPSADNNNSENNSNNNNNNKLLLNEDRCKSPLTITSSSSNENDDNNMMMPTELFTPIAGKKTKSILSSPIATSSKVINDSSINEEETNAAAAATKRVISP